MKKYLSIGFLSLILLSGCVTDWTYTYNKIGDWIVTHVTPAPTPEPVPPTPTPAPTPVPEPAPVITEMVFIADLDLIPARMRQSGIQGRDGILWYGLACSCRGNRGWSSLDNPEIHAIWEQEAAIQTWYDKWMADIEHRLETEPGLRGTILLHDGKDKVGCTLGPAIMERLSKYRDRLKMGVLVPESEY